VRDALEKTTEIKESLQTDNLDLCVTHIHALKSAAANIGAEDLSEIAKSLEDAGNREDLGYIHMHKAILYYQLEKLVDNINRFLENDKNDKDKNDNNDKNNKTESPQSIKPKLDTLAQTIDELNPRAIKYAAKELEPFIQISGIGGDIDEILKNVLIGNYDDALSMIKNLTDSIDKS
jgi:HPt (histidine-containing phosphotransfer) domain-containing protein